MVLFYNLSHSPIRFSPCNQQINYALDSVFQAIERLHVNQMLNSRCIELLESALNGIKAGGETHAVHAMLVVNAKLLALFSR